MAVTVEFDADFAGPATWARMYRGLGLQVVPAHLPRPETQWKRPIVDWVEFQNVLAPDAVFDRWYGPAGAEVRRTNMGLICGAASGGLVVVDLDTQKGPEAMRWWRGLLEVHNNGLAPDTWMQRTGGGGLQLFFKAPEGWTPPTFKAPPVHVDVRGQGGFVVCPPSMHESGAAYEWDGGSEPWACDLELAPDWLVEAIEKLRLEHGGQAPGERREHTASGETKNAFGLDVDDREHKLTTAVWGAVVDLRRDCPIPPDQGLQRSEIDRLWANYERTTKTRLTDAASNAEGLEREGRGRSALVQKWTYAMERWDTKVAEAAAIPRPTDPAADHSPDAGNMVAAGAEVPPPLIRASEWRGEPPTRQWIVPEWIVQGAVNSLYGDGGLGKTLLAQQLAYAVSLGAPWLGLPTVQGRVLGVFCEDDAAELQRRHNAIKAALGHAVGNPFENVWLWPRIGAENTLVRFDKGGLPQLGDFHAELVAQVEALNPSLLILDTLADVFAGNELDRPQVNYFAKRVLGGLIRSQKERGHGLTILLLGHPSVSGMGQGGRGYSGSTAWNNAVRCRIYLTRPEDGDGDARVLTRGKANYAKSGDETAIQLTFLEGVLAADAQLAEGAPGRTDVEFHIERLIREAWADRAPYSVQRGHKRNGWALIPKELARLGHEPGAVRSVLRDMQSDGRIGSQKRGSTSGLAVLD